MVHLGDKVHAFLHGQDITGRVEALDVAEDPCQCSPAWAALIRLSGPAGSLAKGELLQVPVASLEEVA